MNVFRAAMIAAALTASLGGVAKADIYNNVYSVTASEGLSNGSGFNTVNGNPYSGSNTASASFTYTGPINFSNTAGQNTGLGDTNAAFGFSATNISGYSGSGTVTSTAYGQVANFNPGTTIAASNFLASSGSSNGYDFGSYFTFALGTVGGGTTLTITHDDGVSLFNSKTGTQIGTTSSGPTGAVTDTVFIATATDVTLRYSRQNGTPSILQVSAVPEPVSLSLLGVGLIGLGIARRRQAR